MSNTPQGSPSLQPAPAPAPTLAPVLSIPYFLRDECTFDYEFDHHREKDIHHIVPKLKGESNWSMWEHRLYMALSENNKAYVKILQTDDTRPSCPNYESVSDELVREVALMKMGGNAQYVTDIIIQEVANERRTKNSWLRAAWQKEMEKWDQCNVHVCNLIYSTLDPIPASHVRRIENAREAYKILYAEYGTPSWYTTFERFEVLRNLQYKGNNAQGFVRKFKEALEIYQHGSKLDANTTLNFFIHAIRKNPRCQVFIQKVEPDLKNTNFMVDVYREFILAEETTRTFSGTNPTH
ncbi:hypothetical protein PENPOL_c013G02718 [Penicillium polonicum]|uniref:Uncharacterized protein n=1 Tax=Penicillium polonicum TaxID=60169 RepID=A0A1V6NBW3_PENPO|nr:hypothetical protein PENPOL_c013G02718 [Penicillium polonicum]